MHNGFGPGAGIGISLWVAVGAALLLAGVFVISRRHYLSLPKLAAAPEAAPPDCMVVIPARNEQDCIARAVRSLPHDTVIVVDDHSADATAEVARKSGAGVIRAPALAKGAVGKPSACQAGAAVLTSKWILFADADTRFERGFLNAAVSWAESRGVAFLSIYPRIEGENWSERVLGPYAAALFFSTAGPAEDTAVFNGQCLLVRREAYQFIGGHGSVINMLADEMKLAALAVRHRLKIGSVRSEGLAHVRTREVPMAVRRGAFRFMLISPWRGIVILITGTLAALWLPILIWLLQQRHWGAASLFFATPILLLLPWYRSPLRALWAPVAIYRLLPVLWAGFFAALGGRRVNWKGREV